MSAVLSLSGVNRAYRGFAIRQRLDPQQISVGIWRVEKHSYMLASFDLDQRLVWSLPIIASMKPREEQFPDKDEPTTPKSSRLEEARQIIEEYAEGLRQIIKKLRRHLN
jgi:hypothetical protein